jgi:translation initiation factor IF-2
MTGMLTPEVRETILGRAEVRQVFREAKVGTMAAVMFTEGKSHPAKCGHRDGVGWCTRKTAPIRVQGRRKEDAQGYECGIG